jgi:ligand-binding SRPBCC domain-containing protein
MQLFEIQSVIPARVVDVFSFHHDLENLKKISKDVKIDILSVEGNMKNGTIITLLIKKWLLKTIWQLELIDHKPNHSFSDLQLKGPFKYWKHTHIFKDYGEQTLLIDKVEYQLGFFPFLWPVEKWLIKWAFAAMFKKRHETTRQIFKTRKT